MKTNITMTIEDNGGKHVEFTLYSGSGVLEISSSDTRGTIQLTKREALDMAEFIHRMLK